MDNIKAGDVAHQNESLGSINRADAADDANSINQRDNMNMSWARS